MAAKRLKTRERREQIIDTTLQLVAEYGVIGTTLARIAGAVGVTTPALYAHFDNRKEILLGAIDLLIQRRTAHHRQLGEGNAMERLRRIAAEHSSLVSPDNDKSLLALFEFIAAPASEGLREALAEKHLLLIDDIAQIVREGQEEGSVAPDVDAHQAAWMIVSRSWTEDIAFLMGVTDEWNEVRSNHMLDVILSSIAARPQAKNGDSGSGCD